VEAAPALKAALDKEQDTDTRSNIVAALAALETDKGSEGDATPKPEILGAGEFDELIRQLTHEQPEKMIVAAMKLGELRDKRAVEPLVMMFNNGKVDIKVRLAVAEALLKLESAPVEVALLGALRSPNWRIRRNGAAILGQLKAEWAVEPLAKALDDENDTVRKTARAALKHMNTPESRSALGILDKVSEKTTPTRQTGMLTRLPDPRPTTTKSTKPLNPAVQPPTAPPTQPLTPEAVQPAAQPVVQPAQLIQPAAAELAEQAVPTVPTPPVAPTAAPIPTPTVTTPAGPPVPATAAPVHDYDAPTQSQRPPKLAWPKKPDPAPEEDPSKIPTRPLNPRRLEEAEERLNNNNKKPDES
jgi:hypothetical protein